MTGKTKQLWFVYIIECIDKSLYIGITTDIGRRLKEHNSGKGGKYTTGKKPVTLLYNEVYKNRSEALKRENQLKKWTRAKKIALVAKSHQK